MRQAVSVCAFVLAIAFKSRAQLAANPPSGFRNGKVFEDDYVLGGCLHSRSHLTTAQVTILKVMEQIELGLQLAELRRTRADGTEPRCVRSC